MGDFEMRDELVRLLREYAVEAERLGHVFAERYHMHPTDLNALLAVMQAHKAGVPLTPGRLGEHLGLSSGATTAVIDRMERAGHVNRVRDERDRRRVTLHQVEAATAVASAFFGPLGLRMDRMLATYSAAELNAIRRFLDEANELLRQRRRDMQVTAR
jgi:DNA-binding MarR family transcriptional regulator